MATHSPTLIFDEVPLGRLFDGALAKHHRVSKATIRDERERRGIAKPKATNLARLHALIQHAGKVSVLWASKCLGTPQPSVRRNLQTLAKLGLCAKLDDGRWAPAPTAA